MEAIEAEPVDITQPLNVPLYYSLASHLGSVGITNLGVQAIVRQVTRWESGKLRVDAEIKGGEHYYVNCPVCGDKRHRLSISHRYATPHPISGRRIDYLLHCKNDNCFASRQNREWFTTMLSRLPRNTVVPPATIFKAPRAALPASTGQLPPSMICVSELPTNHLASQYLLDRGFDPRTIGKRWGVGYIDRDTTLSPPVHRRIVIPVFGPSPPGRVGPLVGWQARRIDDQQSDSQKYLNSAGFQISEYLYGLNEAAQSSGPVVLMEGVADTWSLGVGAVASFGCTLSPAQIELLTCRFRGRPITVGYDPDVSEKAQIAASKIRRARAAIGDPAPVLICPPPEGAKDFGECTQQCGCETVWHLLEEQRIVVSSQNVLHVYCGTYQTQEDASAVVAVAYPPNAAVDEEETLVGSRAGFAIEAKTPFILHAPPARFLSRSPRRIYFDGVRSMAHERQRGYDAPAEFDDVQLALHLLDEQQSLDLDDVFAQCSGKDQPQMLSRASCLGTQAELISAIWADGELLHDLEAQGLERLYREVEKPCIPALAAMMHRGLLVDLAGLQAAVTNCTIPDTVVGTANSILKMTNRATERVHCEFSVTSAVTGRITASRPNLQGYPNALKQYGVAPAGHVLVEADVSQQDPRVLAELAGDTFSIEQFSKGVDYHRTTAATLLNKSIDTISNEDRQLGKKFNLAMSYGSGVRGLAKLLGTNRAETIRYIDAFNAAHPAIQPWRQTIVSHLREHGFVRTLFGRRRRLPAIASGNPAEVAKAERQAVNAVIQGTAAEIMKLALARLYNSLPEDCHLVLTVHDSVLIECPVEREAEVRDLLLQAMRQPPVDSWLPLEVSIKSGTCWGTMN